MKLECQGCGTRYTIDDAIIPPQGAKIRCRKCSAVISLTPPVVPAPTAMPIVPAAPAPASTARTVVPADLSPEEKAKHEKARRLARVLASDIAIYNKEKKERGLADGNLVAVLGYEIKKSWEIYKERVGPELANGTPYFRDALNDLLAEGKKIF
jgi:predicted Zn finger-like uncharacterized protein